MSKPLSLTLALAFALPTLGALPSSTAEANVRNTMPSTACQFDDFRIRGGFDPFTPNESSHSRYDADLGMSHQYTPSNGPDLVRVTCTVNRNLPLSTAGMSDLEVRFRSLSPFTTKSIQCWAYSFRPDMSIIAQAEKTVTLQGNYVDNTGLHSRFATIDFNNALNASVSKGTYTVECELPSDVGLTSIYSSEVDGIDGN